MSKFIVSVFDSEKAAYEGSRALKDLHQDGNIVVFADAVITKDDQGVVQIQEAADEGPIGTATGMLVGGLLGALAGPAGMAVGVAAGGTAGWISDLHNVGIDTQFLSDVGELMHPGKSAVVAEIAEGWTTPLDTRMEKLGGTVFRRFRADVEDAQIEREIEASNRELDELEAEWEQAVGEAKDKLQAKVDAAKTRLTALNERAKNKLATAATLQDENPGGRMRSLGMQWTYLDRYLSLADELEHLMAVTVDDVRAMISQTGFRPRTIVRLGPSDPS